MIIAALMLICATGILIYNNWDEKRIESEALETVIKLEEILEKNMVTEDVENNELERSLIEADLAIGANSSIKLNGYTYIGIIYIPSLNNLAIPIIDSCSESNLKISACRYAGNLKNNNMVIAGHNYKSIFGKLSKLSNGSIIYFKDFEGNVYKYSCAEKITLGENDVYEMQTGDWDLTLFTCTYSGSDRLTLRFELEV